MHEDNFTATCACQNLAAFSGLKCAGCVSLAGGFVDARGEIDDASLRRIFRQFDHGGDGHLDGSELKVSPRTQLSYFCSYARAG